MPQVLLPPVSTSDGAAVALSRAGSRKPAAGGPVTFTHSPYLLSLFAPLSTTPPHAHRSTSSRACSFDIDRRTTSAARAAGALALFRSPNPHPPTHHLTFACARPLSCRRRRSRSSTQKTVLLSTSRAQILPAHSRARARGFSRRRARRRRGSDDVRRRRDSSSGSSSARAARRAHGCCGRIRPHNVLLRSYE